MEPCSSIQQLIRGGDKREALLTRCGSKCLVSHHPRARGQEDQEFKANLSYIACLRATWTTYNPYSKTKNRKGHFGKKSDSSQYP